MNPTNPAGQPGKALLTSKTSIGGQQRIHSADGNFENRLLQPVTPTAASVEAIKALAASLEYDSDKIFLHVRNTIKYIPIWGSQKGAFACMVDGMGGAFDQAALMMALLQESKYESMIVIGHIRMTTSQAADWLGTDPDNYLSPLRLLQNGYIDAKLAPDMPDTDSIDVAHAWVKINIGGIWYVFDPAFKAYSKTPGIGIEEAIGYDAEAFDAACLDGASHTEDFVQNVNMQGMNAQIQMMSDNLRTWIAGNKPDATLDDILGGRSIVQISDQYRDTVLAYQTPGSATVEYTYSGLPDSYKSKLRFQYLETAADSGIYEFDYEFASQDIAGGRLTLMFDANRHAEFYINGVRKHRSAKPIADSYYFALITVTNNNNPSPFWARTQIGSHHLVGNSWGAAGPNMAFFHQKALNDLLAAGISKTDERVLGESLSVLFHNWNAQKTIAVDNIGRINTCAVTLLNQVGLAGFYRNDPTDNQNAVGAPFLDLGGINFKCSSYSVDTIDPPPADGIAATNEKVANSAASIRGIGFEANTIAQISGVNGVSTDTLIFQANSDSQKIFQATASNWSTIKDELTNYSDGQKNEIEQIVNNGSYVTLHQNGQTNQKDYQGHGYYVRNPYLGTAAGIIDNGSSGSTLEADITLGNFNLNAGTNQAPPTAQLKDENNKVEIDYIVDTQTGDFKYHETDFTIGSQPAPWGMGFTRFHNSKDRNTFSTMGYGWRHNHMITAVEGTNGYASFGNPSGLPSVDSITQLSLIVLLLQRDPNNQLAFLFSSLVLSASHMTLTSNVVNVRDGEKSYVFTRLSDGVTYVAPPGIGLGLVKVPAADPAPSYFRMQSLDGVIWTFRPDGQISTIAYPHGVTWTYTYQSSTALLTSVTNSIGVTIDFTYQTVGPSFLNVLKDVSGISGSVKASYVVLDKGTISKATSPAGVVTVYDYDSKRRMTAYYMPGAVVGNKGIATSVHNTFDQQDRVIQQVNPAGVTTFQYTSNSTTSQSNGRRIFSEFDEQGRAIAITEGTIKTVFQYDGYGRKRYETAPEGNSVEYVYDNNHRITEKTYHPKTGLATLKESFVYTGTQSPWTMFTNKRGKVFVRTINLAGQILTEKLEGAVFQKIWTYGSYSFPLTFTDETDITTTYAEDYKGRNSQTVSSQAGGLNLSTVWQRDILGNANKVTDPLNHLTLFDFDGQRRVIRKTDTVATITFKTEYDYDLRSNKLEERRESDGFGKWQRNKWTYSGSNKVLTTTDPLGYVTKNSYDLLDRLTSTQDPELRTTKYEYDSDLRITKVIDANNVEADLREYTANGKLAKITDARNNVSQYVYDDQDRKSRLTYPDTSYEEWLYDDNGNVTSYRTRSGALITQTFDDYDRLQTRSPANQPVETYLYDNAGRLLSVSTPPLPGDPSSGTFLRGYDVAGRLTSETNPQGQAVSYELDKNGNRMRVTYPEGFYVDRVFDELNRLTSIKLNGSASPAASFQYDRLSRRTQLAYLNGVVTNYQYDIADRRTGMDLTVGGVPSHWQFGFNKVDQMTSAKFPDSTWQWRPTASSTAYGDVNNLNQILLAGAASLSYDGRGNLTGEGTWTYVFNTENMLTSATKTGTAASFDYDPSNRQIRKTTVIGGTTTKTRYVYSGDQLIAEYDDSTGNLLRRYVYALGKDDPIIQIDASSNVTYLHADHLGSIIAQSNGSGVIGNKYQYSPHGESISLTGTTFGFTGQRFDSELGLYYYKARYYSPGLCRFLQADPAGYDVGYNLYPYAKNDPLNLTDPSGNEEETTTGGPVRDPRYRYQNDTSGIPWYLDARPRVGENGQLIRSPLELSLDVTFREVAGLARQSAVRSASQPVGNKTSQLTPASGDVRNAPGKIGEHTLSGHAMDQVQNRGIPMSATQQTLEKGLVIPAIGSGYVEQRYDPINNVRAIVNAATNTVITVMYGRPNTKKRYLSDHSD